MNKLTPDASRGPVKRFFSQFHNVLVYVLLAAAGVTAAIGHWVDSGVIVDVVVINALIGFIQEGKAEKALDAIRNMLKLQAMVQHEGMRFLLPAEQLLNFFDCGGHVYVVDHQTGKARKSEFDAYFNPSL